MVDFVRLCTFFLRLRFRFGLRSASGGACLVAPSVVGEGQGGAGAACSWLPSIIIATIVVIRLY